MNPNYISEIAAVSSLLRVVIYCETSACPAREIEIRVKDYEREWAASRVPTLRCPVCGSPHVTIDRVVTTAEADRTERQAARCSVNVQMRQRDSGDELSFINLRDADDDRLPPTPTGWFDPETKQKANATS